MENLYKQIDAIFEHGLINSLIFIFSVLFFALILNRILNKIINKKYTHDIVMARRVKKLIIGTIIICTIFMQIQPLQSLAKTLLASGGILAVVIGLASQEAASNMINGFMIRTYKPFIINDFIKVISENVTGTVINITLRHTVIETIEKTQMIIPNRIMNNVVIENVSNVPDNKANYLYLDISYESDLDKAISLIQEIAKKHPNIIDPRSKKEKLFPMIPVLCLDFKESGIALRATIYSKDNGEGFLMLSDIRKEILKEFHKNNIVIPYPNVTIHQALSNQ